MTELQQLIDKYYLGKNDDQKAEIIRADFDFLKDNTKWNFLLPLIEDSKTYDLVKVNIYKIIEIADFPELIISETKNRVLQALKTETDEMVRQYAFIALTWSFSSFPDVIDICIEAVENEQEDIDVRHCAFDVLKKSKNVQKIDALRDRLLQTKDFAKYAVTFYNDRK